MSLFSFQDIITAVSGIMILVTLLLVIEILNAKSLEESAPATTRAEETLRRIRSLEAEGDLVQQELAELARQLPDSDAADIERAQEAFDAAREARSDLEERRGELVQRIEELRQLAKGREEMVQDIQRETAELEEQAKQLDEQLPDAQERRATHFTFADQTAKTPILVECSAEGVKVEPRDGKSRPVSFVDPASATVQGSIEEFRDWSRERDPDRDAFIVLVKPGAAGYAGEVVEMLKQGGFDVGYEPLEADRVAVTVEEEAP